MSWPEALRALFAVMALLETVGARAQTHDPGVWVKHDINFQFLGFTSTYSCDGLADKLKILLIAASARGDAKATAGGCASGYGRPDKFSRARLIFYTLAPAADAESAVVPVNGAWRSVVIMDRSPRELRLGD